MRSLCCSPVPEEISLITAGAGICLPREASKLLLRMVKVVVARMELRLLGSFPSKSPRGVRKPRPELWVPRWTQGLTKITQAMPRVVQNGMARLTAADKVLAAADPAARAAYEERARRSADPLA